MHALLLSVVFICTDTFLSIWHICQMASSNLYRWPVHIAFDISTHPLSIIVNLPLSLVNNDTYPGHKYYFYVSHDMLYCQCEIVQMLRWFNIAMNTQENIDLAMKYITTVILDISILFSIEQDHHLGFSLIISWLLESITELPSDFCDNHDNDHLIHSMELMVFHEYRMSVSDCVIQLVVFFLLWLPYRNTSHVSPFHISFYMHIWKWTNVKTPIWIIVLPRSWLA